MMERNGPLALPDAQILDYRMDPGGVWLLLSGITGNDDDGGEGIIDGHMQLFSVAGKQEPEMFQGFAGCFGVFRWDDDGLADTTLWLFSRNKDKMTTTLEIYEAGSGWNGTTNC